MCCGCDDDADGKYADGGDGSVGDDETDDASGVKVAMSVVVVMMMLMVSTLMVVMVVLMMMKPMMFLV